jgi:Cytochrome c biogenesis factor
MVPELGHFALLLALMLTLVQASVPLIGSFTGNRAWMAMARPLAWGQLSFIGIAFLCLLIAFLGDDFSVLYVASNSNTLMPTPYKVSAIWGAHEGSLLLWVLMLAGWGAAVAQFSRHLPLPMIARVLSVQAMVAIGFLLFMLLTSNPFERIFPAPPEGRDLNPLLQDPGLAIHPPLLYMGYVGFSVAFAFAIAALIGGKLDAAWARWSRPWTTMAWVFLTIGIALGSWWAYYELGWGGWWFWDPVENASFMPWLVGTALIHSLAVTEKRAASRTGRCCWRLRPSRCLCSAPFWCVRGS